MSKLPIIILKKLIYSIECFDIQNIIIIFARNISGATNITCKNNDYILNIKTFY